MDNEKYANLYRGLPCPDYTPDNTTDTLLPPPYTDDPPPYSTVAENSTSYSSLDGSIDYMSKLPFGESSNNISNYPILPTGLHIHSQQSADPQMPTRELSFERAIIHQPTSSALGTPQFPQQPDAIQHHRSPPLLSRFSSCPSSPHKILLQPTPSRWVETKVVGRRKTKSHVTDHETGKEYFVKEKTSRNGRKNKAVIVEVGGPKTYVKETPSRTVVCQKKI